MGESGNTGNQSADEALRAQARLIERLCEPGRHAGSPSRVERRETHISHVLLAGEYAYKIKKPLDLGFLDFTRLADRKRYCDEEIRLNARLAPEIYLDVVPITGSVEDPALDGAGDAIEWAVRMRRFDEDGLLGNLIDAERLDADLVERLALRIARFHEEADAHPPDPGLGMPEQVIAPMRENFTQIRPVVDAETGARIEALAAWTEERFEALHDRIVERRDAGRVRECHGDMHAGNIVVTDGEPAIFDGIEFNPAMRWIDVAADIAFLVMDLDARGVAHWSSRVLDTWLATTGDIDALEVLRFYLVYRAMVRAKIAAIRGRQVSGAEAAKAADELRRYCALAERYAGANAPALILTHGVAGSGKSTAAMAVVERLGAVRLRSDVERRRLFAGATTAERYAREATDRVYQQLREHARTALRAGFPVVVDATFLESDRRAPFRRLADQLEVPWRILDLEVAEDVLARRIRARAESGDDVSEADVDVMRQQLADREPLSPEERGACIVVDNAGPRPVVPALDLPHARGLVRGG